MAQVVVDYVNLINECEKYLPYINPPDSILLESSIEAFWNYKWQVQEGYYIFLKVSIYPDNSSGWEVKFWGTDTTTGELYHNWIFLYAGQSGGKDEGSISPYQVDEPNIVSSYSWRVADDTLKYIFLKTSYDGQVFIDLETHGCSNLSGKLIKRIKISDRDFYRREMDGIIEYEFSWDADGKGQWWRYDVERNVIDTGSWN